MKAFIFLLPLVAAIAIPEDTKCQCPQVKCPGDDAVALCNCLNSAETLCKNHCPEYTPTYRPCPTKVPNPTTAPPKPTPSTKPPKCVCDVLYCPQVWPESCHCGNNSKKVCYEQCGGAKPEYQTCPDISNPATLITRLTRTLAPSSPPPTKSTKPASSTKPTPTPSFPKNPLCGGGRGNYRQCADGWTCIKDPRKPGCGPECDGFGICVKDKMCGGIAGFGCPEKGMVCVDDPRDDCSVDKGGADCSGVCIWEKNEGTEEGL
ncbi:hypothetical protein B0J11DRAFT_579505 [Dendryphion nanum]|uniref:Uncharacterized protein n=1 Tax=Dendryphion nanum TaxID=256645 RepID=A0A9P9DWL8_9PLEO|nr:hypothetical protein B0J11DRAFT_579505 [Dendryphion nanum]